MSHPLRWVPAGVLSVVVMSACSGAAEQADTTTAATAVDRQAIQEQGEQAQARQASCMADRGFDVTYDQDGNAMYGIPEGEGGSQSVLDNLAACRESAGFPTDIPPATAEEISRLYDEELERVECLRAEGVEPVSPPSRDKYIEDFLQAQEAGVAPPWDPMPHGPGSVPPGVDVMEVQRVCPPVSLADL